MASGTGGNDIGNGLNAAELQNRDQEDLGGSGGGAGGGTTSGAGDPSGGLIGGTGGGTNPNVEPGGGLVEGAAALGGADGSLADAAQGASRDPALGGRTPVGGETVGTGASRGSAGSGAPRDTGDLGGGGGGTGPAGTGSPGGVGTP